MLTLDSIQAVTPTERPDQRNFKVHGETQDLVLMAIAWTIYMHSSSREILEDIGTKVWIQKPEFIDTKWKERMYGWLSGFLLKTDYKKMSWGVLSIKTLFQKHAELIQALEIHH